ncbi:MAG TPA: hypothetical protein VGF69_21595, partial [Thermoanaerobaculia bacterium]
PLFYTCTRAVACATALRDSCRFLKIATIDLHNGLVMQTTTNYRLERWIALLLGLLFFLPFLAR